MDTAVTKRAWAQTLHLGCLGSWLMLWLPLVLLAEVPIFSSYLLNVAETSVQDLLLPLLLNFLVATIIAGVMVGFFRRHPFRFLLMGVGVTFVATEDLQNRFGGIASSVSSFFPLALPVWLVGFSYFCALIYGLYWASLLLDRLVVKKRWPAKEMMGAVVLAIGGFFLAEFVPAAINLAEAWPQFFYKPPVLPVAASTTSANGKPDIYYILLEDYASQSVLQNQMKFDNSAFLNELGGAGFYNVPAANSNYPYTVNSVASTLGGGYLSDAVNRFSGSANQTLIPYFTTAKKSPVIQELKNLGYSYDLLGDWYETSNYSPLADRTYTNDNQIVLLNHVYGLNDFTDAQVQKNILWNLIAAGVKVGNYRVLGYNSQDDVTMVKAQLAKLHELAAAPAGGRFIFSQILAPHNFFPFNADGSINNNPTPDNVGLPAITKDTNEIQYINGQISSILSEIMRRSGGKANIILQSDEGPPVELLNNNLGSSAGLDQAAGNMAKWSQASLEAKFGILASYYVPGAPADDLALAANPVNIFRLVLNTNFGTNLPYLPLCYFGFAQGENEAFVYEDVTANLTGQANPKCPANGNFIKPGPTKLIKHAKISTQNDEGSDND